MQMNDIQSVPAPRDQVWAALNDPEILRKCIPGCQSLEMISPTEMTATVVVKLGPVKATFTGKVTLSDLDPPNGYRISGEGSGGVAGFAKGGATVKLESPSEDVTNLAYQVDAQIGGKLAQLGGRLIELDSQEARGRILPEFRRRARATASVRRRTACDRGRERAEQGLAQKADFLGPADFRLWRGRRKSYAGGQLLRGQGKKQSWQPY